MYSIPSTICLVTPRHISYNPRLVKEADALQEAGSSVRVVAVSHSQSRAQMDKRLMEERTWSLATVQVTRSQMLSTARWMWASIRQRISQKLYPFFPNHLRDVAYSRYLYELASLAAEEPADLYIAHNLEALPAAYRAAQHHDSIFGFDAEDFHRGQFFPEEKSLSKTLTKDVEEAYLPLCDHVTAASEGIAKAYSDILNIPHPDVILNVFPIEERRGHTPAEELEAERPPGNVVSLYWYSQVIGPNRGLSDALCALSELDDHIHLTLRGRWAKGFEDQFRSDARALGVEHRLRVLSSVPPEQLVERAAQHDVGLALEQVSKVNRDLCVTNKILAYLLAGLPVVATDTTGQRQIHSDRPEAIRLCSVGDPESLATAIHTLVSSDSSLSKAKAAARVAGSKRYNWEYERQRLLESIDRTLATPAGMHNEARPSSKE